MRSPVRLERLRNTNILILMKFGVIKFILECWQASSQQQFFPIFQRRKKSQSQINIVMMIFKLNIIIVVNLNKINNNKNKNKEYEIKEVMSFSFHDEHLLFHCMLLLKSQFHLNKLHLRI